MKKNLLIALALPAMFAACSQEDVLTEGQLQQGNLLGTPAGEINFILNEGVDSRMAWGATTGPAWNANDAFSLFWVGEQGENVDATNNYFKSATNALYQRADEKSPFTSQNVVYVGKHIVVYPADKAHFSNKEIEVSVGQTQADNVDLGLRSVFVSDLLTIADPTGVSERDDETLYAGYDEPVVATVSALSTNMVMNLKFALTENMQSVTIKKVELEAYTENETAPVDGEGQTTTVKTPANVFAKGGYLKLDDNNHMSLYATDAHKISTMTLTMPETAVVTKAEPTYVAQLSLLPQTVEAGTKFAIKVYTNYGLVTIDKAKMVTKNGKYQIEAGTNYSAEVAENITANTALSFMAEFNDAAECAFTTEDPSYGFRFAREVSVDMSTASIANWEVTTSNELIAAYGIYDLLEKEGAENFVLTGVKVNTAAANERFELTPAALAAIKAHEDVTLTIQAADTLVLTGAFDAVPELTEVISTTTNHSDVTLALGEGTEWTLDVKNAKIFNSWNNIAVFGSLTISESEDTNDEEEPLNVSISNYGDVTFNGEVTMIKSYSQVKGNTTVPAAAFVTFENHASTITAGTVEVEGTLIANNEAILAINESAIVNVAGSLLQSNNAKINNAGTINIATTGAAIINNNEIDEAVGSIVLASRTNSVTTNSAAKGYIKFAFTGEEFKSATTDAFNYLILSNNIKIDNTNLTIKNIEVAANATVETTTTAAITLDNVFVNAGAKLRIPVGSEVSTTNTSGAGNVEVYGSYSTTTNVGFTGKIFRFQSANTGSDENTENGENS